MLLNADTLPNNPEALKQHIVSLQAELQAAKSIVTKKQTRIEQLEEQLRAFQRHRFGKRSEKYAGQYSFHFFNEVELLTDGEPVTAPEETQTIPEHKRRKKKKRNLPANLPEVDVVYTLEDNDRQCACGQCMVVIGTEISRQLAVIPQQYYVINHIREKYGCRCKQLIKTASMPPQPIPKSQASPALLAHLMVSKYLDGLPLYRLEKIAKRNGIDMPRDKTARWLIQCKPLLQSVYNLLQDQFFHYDIALSDDTGIQVLKENGREPENKSYLWIRRGGPPDKPVVLVDYSPSRSGNAAYGLLEHFTGYLVADAYGGYNQAIAKNALKLVACNDHARRKFVTVIENAEKAQRKNTSTAVPPPIASQAVAYYRALYRIETEIKPLPPEEKQRIRQEKSRPLWQEFHAWLLGVNAEGIAHSGTAEAVTYALNHWQALTRYCEDGRLPISNIQSEHVAKTIALARKNFLFADTPAGAEASAMIYSLLESAKANNLHPYQYMTVLLTELPKAKDVDAIEALLPWNFTQQQLKRQFDRYPSL